MARKKGLETNAVPVANKNSAPHKGLAAKAGYRKLPMSRGPHLTTPEQRRGGRFLSKLSLKSSDVCDGWSRLADFGTKG